jgi:hypothetical protein
MPGKRKGEDMLTRRSHTDFDLHGNERMGISVGHRYERDEVAWIELMYPQSNKL